MRTAKINWTRFAAALTPLTPHGVFFGPDGEVYGPDGSLLVPATKDQHAAEPKARSRDQDGSNSRPKGRPVAKFAR